MVFGGAQGLVASLAERVADLEARWSRFIPTSEISQLNTTGGPLLVSDETVRLLRTAIEAHRLTGGLFDPLMLEPLCTLGYDRDHRSLDSAEALMELVPTDSIASDRGTVMLDHALGTVAIPHGCRFDPGGIGKGVAADILAAEALTAEADGVFVELGGDIRLGGSWYGSPRWPVLVADPWDPRADLARIEVFGGAVATSSTLRRRWRHDGAVHHHLLDPATERPAVSDLVSVTVHAGSAWAADALAMAAVIAGRSRAIDLLRRVEVNALLIGRDGGHEIVGSLDIELVGAASVDGHVEVGR